MTRIILVGYMGSGKTTVGRQLAMALGLSFYDLDWYIEMRYRRSVAQIFRESGEEGFRQLENIVLSCGGGTPCFFDNMSYMNSLAETVYLKARPDVLAAHLRMGKVVRPLIQGKNEEELLAYIEDSLRQREPYYSQARHTLDVSLLDNYDKVQTSVRLLRELLGV